MHSETAGTTTTLLTGLGEPEALLAEVAKSPDTGKARLRTNAHIHLPPNFSAFDTVTQAVDLAVAQGVNVLGASNYYDYGVYQEFTAQTAAKGIFPLFGLEIITLIEDLQKVGLKINDPGNPGKMYLCGKGITRFDPLNPEARDLLAVIQRNDSERMAKMIAKLAGVFVAQGIETSLDETAVKERVARRHDCPVEAVYLQERHVAQAFQEVLFEHVPPQDRPEVFERLFGVASKAGAEDAVAVQGEIRSHLMKAGKAGYSEETFVDFDHAYRLILALGGVPWYPTLVDGASPVCPYEADVDTLIADLRGRGIFCAEFIPVRNAPDVLAHYVLAMRRAGLVVTAGTEHNTLDLIALEPTCLKGAAIPEEVQEIFWEGACVVAAHQYLVAQGRTGYVDSTGKPNADYASDEDRIQGLARLGAIVIERFRQQTAK